MSDDEGQYPSPNIEDIDDITLPETANQPIAYDANSESERIHKSLIDALETVEEREPESRGMTLLTEQERTLLLEFFTVSAANIERLSASILTHEIASEEFDHERGAHNYFWNELSQSDREGLLYYSGLIDSGLKGELARVRQRRNELVHEQISRRYVSDVNKLKADADRAMRSIQKLDSIWDVITSD